MDNYEKQRQNKNVNNGDLNESNEKINTNILTTLASDKNKHTHCDDLITVKKDLNVLKQYNMSNDIIATGVPEVKNEILIDTINKILINHEIILKNTDIKRIYRLKNKKSSMIAPIFLLNLEMFL